MLKSNLPEDLTKGSKTTHPKAPNTKYLGTVRTFLPAKLITTL
jgi:hypothetical protein